MTYEQMDEVNKCLEKAMKYLNKNEYDTKLALGKLFTTPNATDNEIEALELLRAINNRCITISVQIALLQTMCLQNDQKFMKKFNEIKNS